MSWKPTASQPLPELFPPLSRSFYEQPTLAVARALIGRSLYCRTPAGVAGGIVVETEAYIASVDPAAHGYTGKTRRNATMFGPPGHAYVYQSYGMHICLNVVTEQPGAASAVLIRALEPTIGQALMRERRGPKVMDRDIARGPGRLCQALGITLEDDGADLLADHLWLAETPGFPLNPPIATTSRIGITRGTDLMWRFVLVGSRYVSARQVREGDERAAQP